MDSTKVMGSPKGIATDAVPTSDGAIIGSDTRTAGQDMGSYLWVDGLGLDSGSSAAPGKGKLSPGGNPAAILPGPVNDGLPNIGKDTNNWGQDTTVQVPDSDTFPYNTVSTNPEMNPASDAVSPGLQGIEGSIRLPKTSFPPKDPTGSG